MSNKIILLFLALAFVAWTFPNNKQWESKVSSTLLIKMQEQNKVECLVVLQQQADLSAAKSMGTKEEKGQFVFEQLKATAQQSQSEIVQLLRNEGTPFQAFYVVNAIRVHANAALIQRLAERPEVAQLIDNSAVQVAKVQEEPDSPFRGPSAIEWGIDMINADDVWAMGYTGQDVVVGGQDTGVEWDHYAIKSQYRGWDGATADHNYNWHDAIREINLLHGDSIVAPENNPCGLNTTVPCDDNNHGTHTVGTMVGDDGDGNQIGVAPGAKWIACRNMERGYGSPSTYIESFEWFLAPTDSNNENADPTKAPHVINNSWGCPELEGCNSSNWAVMEMVVSNLKTAGIVVVVSAGNSGGQGCGSVSNPAAIFEQSFSIGSSRSNDTISGFSSRGPVTVDGSNRMKPNVVAPGSGVRSCVRGGGYSTFSGTSMAGPHVAGLVALIISANPALAGNVDAIEDIIESTAVAKTTTENCGGDTGTAVPNNTYGFGRVDALAAVNAALAFTDVEEINVASIRVFPNPFEEVISFDLGELNGQTNLTIYNTIGQMVHTSTWSHSSEMIKEVRLTDLAKGVYFYEIRNGGERFSGKLIR